MGFKICATCHTNRAVAVDYREVNGITDRYASCDTCRFLPFDYWIELRSAMTEVDRRCNQCIFRILRECEKHKLPIHFVSECEYGKVKLPVWFINEHVETNNY